MGTMDITEYFFSNSTFSLVCHLNFRPSIPALLLSPLRPHSQNRKIAVIIAVPRMWISLIYSFRFSRATF